MFKFKFNQITNDRISSRKGSARPRQPKRISLLVVSVVAAVSVCCLLVLYISRGGLFLQSPPSSPSSHDVLSRVISHHVASPPKLRKEQIIPNIPNKEFPFFGSSQLDTWNYTPLGRHRYLEWSDGSTPYNTTPAILTLSNNLARLRRTSVRSAMQHAWSGYRACAFGKDEVAPATCQGKDIDNYGVSTTLVDSLDTLWLMGMKEEFEEAREWIGENLEHDADKLVSTFENTIRSLGGLLSAYDWSGDAVFLEKAVDLGDRLIKAFDSPSGIPYSHVNLKTGVGKNSNWNSRGTSIAEAGTLQIEFRFLAKVTGNVTYADKAEHVFDLLGMLKTEDGLYFNHVMNMNNVSSTSAGSKLTFGGEAGT